MATASFERASGGAAGRNLIGRIMLYAVLVLIALFFLLPLVWMFSTAFKPFVETLQPTWIPQEPTLQTLPVGLATLQGQYAFDYGKLMAGAAVTAVPVLLLYIFLQRYIIQNVAMTGLKG